MDDIQLISRNSMMVGLREVILKLAGFITFPIIARSIGVSVLGILGTAQALAGILFLVADLGLNKSLIKEVAQNRENGDVIFSNALVLKTVSMTGAFLVGLILVKFSCMDGVSTRLCILVLLLGFFVGIHELGKSLFSAYERMEFLPLIDGLSKMCTLGAVVLIFFVLKASIIELQVCSIFITVAIIALSLELFNKKVSRIKFNPQSGLFRALLKMSVPFMMVGLFAQTFGYVDSLMLASMVGTQAVGLYQVAYKLVVLLQLIPATISTALFPTLSRLYVANYSKFEYGVKRIFKYLLILSIPLTTSLYLMAPSIVDRIFGEEYMESAGLVSILAWTLIFIFITFPIGISLGVSGNQKYNVIAVICGSTANIIMNYVFITFWGITGVAISTVLTAAIIFICSTYFFKKVFKEIFMLEKSIWFLFICSIIFAGLQYLLSLKGVAGAVIFDGIFFLVVFAFKMIDREDRAIFLQVIRLN